VAVRLHWFKMILADSDLGEAVVRQAYERGFVACAVEPTGTVGMKKAAFDTLETLFSRSGFDRATFNFKSLLDDLAADGNLRRLTLTQGGEALVSRRAAQLATLLGDDCNETIMKNFLKVADERLVMARADDSVDEFFESFFSCFEGNPSLLKQALIQHADDIGVDDRLELLIEAYNIGPQ
jgi:hypothetical protein